MNTAPAHTALLAILAAALLASRAVAFETVVIDPGHGGNDEGTSWYHVDEKTITLGVARRLERILTEKGINVVLTRHTDTYVSLDERAEIGNRYPDSLFLSIHFNGFYGRGITGFQSYHFKESPSGKVAAEAIQNALAEGVSGRSRGVMTNDYAVLVRTIGTAVLTECGFISNKQDAARFASDEGQEDLAQALAKGVMRIKPMINFDPPECELAKCGIYERKFVEKERKLAGSSKSTPSRSSGSSKVSRKKKTAS